MAQKKTFPEETTTISLKENTLVSMVEGKGCLLFVWWWSSFSFFETSCGRLFSNHAFDLPLYLEI
jgi:hypothetical protein